jgi:flavin-dependent dehydrogenase
MGALEGLDGGHGVAAALTGMIVTAPSGERIRGAFAAHHGFHGFRAHGLGVRREILDTRLLERVRAVGVDVLESAKVEQLLFDADGTVSGVRARLGKDLHEIRAALVVGADGLRSVVSRRLGLAHHAPWPRRLDVSG